MSTSRLPSVEIGGQKVAPFKDPDSKPYGGFANTTKGGKYPVKQDVEVHGEKLSFNWPSSEHAYHAQKLINLKGRLSQSDPEQAVLTNALRQLERTKAGPGEEFLPRDDFDPLVDRIVVNAPRLGGAGTDDKSKRDEFNKHCVGGDFGLQEKFMRDVIKLKLEQNPELKDLAMQMAREGVIPVEFSRHDSKWASGVDGTGKNLLGIMILEEGNRLLLDKSPPETPAITDPRAAYQNIVASDSAKLKHDALTDLAREMKPPTPSQPSTSTATMSPSSSSSTSTSESDAEKLEEETKKLRELQTKAESLSMEAGDKGRAAEDLKRKADEDQEKATLAKQEFDGLETEASKLPELTQKVDLAKVAATTADLELANHLATAPEVQSLKTESDKAEKDYRESIVPPSTEGDPDLKAKAGVAKQKYDQACLDKGAADPVWKSTFDSLVEKQNTTKLELDALVKDRNKSQESSNKLVEARAKVESTKLTADASKQAYTQANTLAEQSKQASVEANKEVEKQQQKVDQLNQPTTPQDSKQSDEEKKKEEAKKAAEQQKREKERENTRKMQFAELYSNKRGWPRDQWENIYDPNSGEKDADKDTPRLSSGSGDNDFETKPGRYQHPKHGGADVRYYEDGSVKPIPPSKFGVWNKDGYSASMDFLAGRLGASTIKISLPLANDPRLKSHNKKQLRELLQMAHKKGLSVEFDKSTMDFLDTLSNKDAKRFLRARDLLAQNAMKNDMLVGAGDTKELNNAKIKAGQGVLDGKATEAEYTKSKLDGKTTIDDKLSVVDAELDKLDKHASDMRDLNQRMQSLSNAAEGLLSKPDNLADLHREHIYRTKWQRFKDLIRPNVRENAKRYEDYTQGIADIERKFEKEKDKRGNLVESIDKKLDKLDTLRAEWKKELDKLKADNGRKPDSDPSKKKLEDKIKKLEKKLDEIDGKLKEGKKEVADLKKNEQDFKAKIVAAKEKAEQYKAGKQAKIGN